jgi:hypothetical protein
MSLGRQKAHRGGMVRRLPALIAILTTLVIGSGIAAAVVWSGGETAAPAPATSTTVPTSTTAAPAATTSAPPTTAARVTTTTRRVTTTRPPTPTTVTAPTTTRPALSRAAATQGLCSEIETAVRQVVGGNTLGGGLRLLRAINTYGDAADPTVVTPARRMASAGVNGDLDASAAATQEAASACRRLGFPVNLPGGVQCVTTPCP